MDMTFWAGAVIGAVLGLAVDLWKRPLDRLLDRRLENRVSVRAGALIGRLQQDRQGLRDYLVVQVLETTLIGSLTGILAGLLFATSSMLAGAGGRLSNVVVMVGQIVAIVGSAMIVRIAGDAVTVARQVAQSTASTADPDSPDPT